MEQDNEGEVEQVPAADFVSAIADNEPTNAEWESILKENGYTNKQIEEILNA